MTGGHEIAGSNPVTPIICYKIKGLRMIVRHAGPFLVLLLLRSASVGAQGVCLFHAGMKKSTDFPVAFCTKYDTTNCSALCAHAILQAFEVRPVGLPSHVCSGFEVMAIFMQA